MNSPNLISEAYAFGYTGSVMPAMNVFSGDWRQAKYLGSVEVADERVDFGVHGRYIMRKLGVIRCPYGEETGV